MSTLLPLRDDSYEKLVLTLHLPPLFCPLDPAFPSSTTGALFVTVLYIPFLFIRKGIFCPTTPGILMRGAGAAEFLSPFLKSPNSASPQSYSMIWLEFAFG